MTFVVGALALLGAGCADGGPSAPVTLDTRLVVETLASDEFEGRLTGSEGIRAAGEYIVELLNFIGAEPLPDQTDFRLPFEFTAGVSDGGTMLDVAGGSEEPRSWGEGAVQALSFSKNGSVTGPLVFVGYGLSVPETDDFSYDSYATLDVTDKVALVLRYFPEDTEGELRGTLSRYAGLRFKALAARERGAVGLIVVAGPRSPNAGTLVPMTFDTALSGSNVVAASVTGDVGEALVARTGKTLEEVQASLDTGNPHVTGFEIPDTVVTVSVSVNREQRTGHNIVGYLPPSDVADVVKPHVMLGGHYDHLGYGTGGNSLARDDEAGEIHNGADDNASGVAAILSAGAQLAATERQRGIILAFWSGEELGLLGSDDFVQTAPVAMDQIAAYLNFDMVGRLTDNQLSVQAVGSSSIWTELVNELNEPFGFDLQFVEDPYLPTDVMSLNLAAVPSVAFFTGSHEDYHRPTDDPETVNYTGLDRIAELGAALAARLATRVDPPDFVKAEPTIQRNGRGPIRIFTGTIPNYAAEAEGLLLSGVVGGGPAQTAGLQGGDVIVELAGQAIANIYDYTYALDLLKVGESATVVFMRDGERIETALVPEGRQ